MRLLLLVAAGWALYWLWKNSVSKTRGMTVTAAARLLEVATDASPETILAAHRRLISRVHPDTGGSAALAAQVNQARDILLKHISP